MDEDSYERLFFKVGPGSARDHGPRRTELGWERDWQEKKRWKEAAAVATTKEQEEEKKRVFVESVLVPTQILRIGENTAHTDLMVSALATTISVSE